jgi:hypothetical protein
MTEEQGSRVRANVDDGQRSRAAACARTWMTGRGAGQPRARERGRRAAACANRARMTEEQGSRVRANVDDGQPRARTGRA